MADNTDVFDLGQLRDKIRSLTLSSLNPLGKIDLAKVANSDEIEAIEEDVIYGVHKRLKEFKERGLLIG